MNIQVGCKYIPTVEELTATLPGANKELYEDDAEEILEQIAEQNAMKPVAAWKELKVTAVREDGIELDGIPLTSAFLAQKLSEGDSVYGAVMTAGKELHRMLADCDDIMQEYILGFLMSHILTVKTVDTAEELCVMTGLGHAEMIMAGIPEVCGLDQQVQVAKMLAEECRAAEVTVSKGGNLSPSYSMTAFFLLSDKASNIPENWEDREKRDKFGKKLFESAGHS